MTAITSGLLGVNITATPATNTFGVAVGTEVCGADGTTFELGHAAEAIAQYSCVGIDSNGEVSLMTNAIAADGWKVGFAQVAAADNDYFWIATKGKNIRCAVLTGCAADVKLYTTDTSGSLDDSSGTAETLIEGLVGVAAHVTGTDNIEVLATFPRSTLF